MEWLLDSTASVLSNTGFCLGPRKPAGGKRDDVGNKHVETDTRVESSSRRPGLCPLYGQHTHSHTCAHTHRSLLLKFMSVYNSTNLTHPNKATSPAAFVAFVNMPAHRDDEIVSLIF